MVLLGLAGRSLVDGRAPAGAPDSLWVLSPDPEPPESLRVAPPGIEEEGRIRVNDASAEDLVALPRIGPVLARRIVEERERGGAFRASQDLQRVRGIGPATAARLAPLVSFNPGPSAADCTKVVHDAPQRRATGSASDP